MNGRRSTRVTLVLLGVAALAAACSDEDDSRRDVYAKREDCLADWANKPEDCTPATQANHAGHGFWYGPVYPYRSWSSGNTWTSQARTSRAVGSTSTGVSRGGFGSSAHSSGG